MQNFLLQTQSEISSTVTSVFGNIVEQLQPELPHTGFVTDLAVIMIVAAIATLAFFKIRQPLIIGYLFAGMIIGPLSPLWSWLIPNSENLSTEGVGFLTDISAMNLFAEIGVILLLFVIGIEFPYAKIRSIGRMAVGVGTIGLFSTLGAVFYVATLLGLGFMDALFIGAALSISSTAIIVKLLEESGRIKKESSIIILGVLIIEDIIAVILISSLQSFALVGSVAIESVAVVIIIAASLIIGTFTIGTKIIPRLIDRVASAENREILLLSVLGVCFGYALLANIVGLSVAIGAFLAGVLVAESRSAEVAKVLSSPIKDMFVAIFFISVGALMDISQIYVIAIILIAVTIAVKFGGSLFGNLIFGRERSKAMHSAFVLSAPRGEFSIVIIKAGIDIGAISAFLFPLIGVITIITSFITPLIFKLADKVIPKITGVENE